MDRDTKFIPLRAHLAERTHTEVVLLPPRSPNLNAPECVDKMIFFSEGQQRWLFGKSDSVNTDGLARAVRWAICGQRPNTLTPGLLAVSQEGGRMLAACGEMC